MVSDGLISQVQAATLLGLSRARVNQLINEGVLTPIPLAGKNLLLLAQVVALKDRRKETAVDGSTKD
mgnify:CR=1 FL=1